MALFSFSPPSLGLHIGRSSLSLVEVERSRGRLRLRGHRVASIEKDAVSPSAVDPNLANAPALAKTLKDLAKPLGRGRQRIVSMSLPDPAIRTMILRLDQLPARADERDKLIRWTIERTSAVPVQDARLVFQALRSPSGHRLLVSTIQVSILRQYEGAVSEADLTPGIVDGASFHTFNLYRSLISRSCPDGGDFAFLNLREDYYTIILFADGEPDFIRVKAIRETAPSDDPGGDLLATRIMEDLSGSLTFYEERAEGRRIARLFPFGDVPGGTLAKRAEEELHLDVVPLDPGRLENIDGIEKVRVEELPSVIPALAAAAGRS